MEIIPLIEAAKRGNTDQVEIEMSAYDIPGLCMMFF
tara:strand:- start:56 stop:163 length:108 start_codon:yes stop_codon:yes gene_type:complete